MSSPSFPRIAALLLFLGWIPSPAAGADGSRYLPLDHWGYEGIALLQQAGHLPGLNPSVQPYRRADVARELNALDPQVLAPGLAHWTRLLQTELAGEGEADRPGVRWGTWIEAAARGSTSDRLEPLRPLGETDNLWPLGRVGIGGETGPAAGEVILLADRFLDKDPDGLDPQRRVARTETAYLSMALPFGEVMVGKLVRNWSRLGTQGLLVGGGEVSYPQVGLEIRAGRFALRSLLGELDSLGPIDTLGTHKRYVTAHRIDLTWPKLNIHFGESVLFASQQPGFSLRHLNPVEVFYFESDAEPEDVIQNLMLDLGASWRWGRMDFYGEGLLDDVELNPPEGADREPTSYAFRLGGRWQFASAGHVLGLEYSQVSAWAYRTPNEVDRYTFLGRGLGEAYSDHDLVTVWADLLAPWPGLRLTPVVQILRQGEGDFRDPVPDYPVYLSSPNLFLGTRENTVRFGLRGRYQPRGEFWVGWDAGANIVENRDHVPDAELTSFSAVVEAGLRFHLVRTR